MKALCTTVINGTRFFLTPDGFATDILKRAKTFRDGSDAQIAANCANAEAAWQAFSIYWEGVYMLHSGEIA